jgi:thiol-disulfide isomerase/thioredoxin
MSGSRRTQVRATAHTSQHVCRAPTVCAVRIAAVRLGWLVGVVVGLVAVAGCATGSDAVASGGEFQFVAPGNQTVINYDPPASRGRLTAFSGESLTEPGRQIGIQDFPGQVVVINVWGSWCGPCRAEMADLQALHDQFASRGVAVLGLDIRDSRPAASDFVRAVHATYPSIFDEPGRALFALSGYPRNVVPSTIVLDREHRVATIYLTRIRPADLANSLNRLLVEPTT